MQKILHYGIVLVWIINGLFCKILNLVPRHEQIVSKILGLEDGRSLTIVIGGLEVLMGIWILSRFRPKLCAWMQMIVIAVMNVIEFISVPELLLWGKFNSLFAAILIFMIYYNEFIFNKKAVYPS